MKKVLKIILLAACAFLFIGTFEFLWQKARPSYFTYELVTIQSQLWDRYLYIRDNPTENEVDILPDVRFGSVCTGVWKSTRLV